MSPSGMVWWRCQGSLEWRFGYATHLGSGMVRMGRWNGDTSGGSVFSVFDIEWKK